MSVLQKSGPTKKRDRHRQFSMQTNQWRAGGGVPWLRGSFLFLGVLVGVGQCSQGDKLPV